MKHSVRLPNGLSFTAVAPLAFVVMWASGAIAVEGGLPYTSVSTFLLLRALGAAVLSWSIWFFVRDKLPRSRLQWLRLCAVAVLLQVVYQGFFFLALGAGLPAGVLAVIVGFQPILTALIIRPGRDYGLWAGLVVGLLGVAMTVSASLQPSSSHSAVGVVFAFFALGAITVGTVVQGKASDVGIWSSLAIQSSLSSMVFAVIVLSSGKLRADGRMELYLAVGWMILIVSVGATALLYLMVTRGEATRVSSLFYCVPPVTAILDWLVFGRILTQIELLGVGLVVAAVAFIQWKNRSTTNSSGTPRQGSADTTKSTNIAY